MQELQIFRATFNEMDFLLSLAKGEGWNPGLQDALPFYSTDPKTLGNRARLAELGLG